MNDIVPKLRAAGLTDGEARVYVALLQLGEVTTGPIVEHSHISSSKIYAILDRLEKKGLVTHYLKNNRNVFSTTDTSSLKHFLELQDEERHAAMHAVSQLLPAFAQMRVSAGPLPEVSIAEGAPALKSGMNQGLEEIKKGDTQYILGVPKEAQEFLPFFEGYHARRIKKGIRTKILYSIPAKGLAEKRMKMPLTEVRFLPEKMIVPASISIVPARNEVTFVFYGDRIFYISITGKKLMESFLAYFEVLWETAKP